MTKTANDDRILTKIGILDIDKRELDWTISVTSTEHGVNQWEEVDYSRYENWLENQFENDEEI